MDSRSIPPGCMGNLSPIQERCLLRLWALVLYLTEESSPTIFGKLLPIINNLEPVQSNSSSSPPLSPSTTLPSSYSTRNSIFSRAESIRTSKGSGTFLRPSHVALIQSFRDAGCNASQARSIRRFLASMSPEEVRFGLFTTIKNEPPDVYLLRYLRVAKWDVNRAFAKMLDALVWRFRKMQVEKHLLPRGELYALQRQSDPSDRQQRETARGFMSQLRMGKFFVRGVDRLNRPVIIMKMRLHEPGAQSDAALHQFLTHTVECVRLLVAPPIESGTVLLDMTGFTLANMEYGPVKFILRCFETYYPESLGVLLVHKAPPVFAGVWKVIKGWLDPELASKIHFTRTVQDLEQFIHRDEILKEYGGNDPWRYKYPEPNPSENLLAADFATRNILLDERNAISEEFFAATSRWLAAINLGDREMLDQAIAMREEVADRLCANYWDLDPYVRARNYLDRMGAIQDTRPMETYVPWKTTFQIQTAKIIQVEHVERARLRVVNV